MKKIIVLILIMLSPHIGLWAQKGWSVQVAFDEFSVKKNATEVVMSGKRLKDFHLNYFHSLEIKNPSVSDRQRITSLVKADAAQAITKEENSGHRFYELPNKSQHAYILYRDNGSTLTLIYIEGKANLKQIKQYFQKKQK
ncbi:MAG: DUF6108 family protein [Bacteroidaceae bacterium]|nr:DUF6108 family protein [Bacteroidaceae bacterium]